MSTPHFPQQRPRRLRRQPLIRQALADTRLAAQDLILPIFVSDAPSPTPVASMPGVEQLPVSHALDYIGRLSNAGVTQFILFGVTPEARKDSVGSYAIDPMAPVNRLLEAVKSARLPVVMYADLCFCEYTSHGHCGVLDTHDPQTMVDNDATLKNLARAAVAQAHAGADVVAPSGMMDGMVAAIRRALDHDGFPQVAILSYSVKYASSFYGPFREAGGGGMKFGDRKSYQMDYRRTREWRTELEADIAQGADMVMVKPAAAYLDVIHQVRQACALPVVAYHVSGEYAMLHAAARNGWLDLKAAALETTYAIKRAGADLVISYFAPQLVEWLK